MTISQQHEPPPDFSSKAKEWDDPRNAPDTLSRAPFAEKIADALSNWKKDESLIVALYGPWGSGKTWLLHRITERLEVEGDFTICDFNPWQFESNEQIITEFFNAVLETLPKDGEPDHEKRAKLWATLGTMVSVAQIGVAAASVANPALAAASPFLGGINQLMKHGADAAGKAGLLSRFRNKSNGNTKTVSQVRKELFELFKQEDAPKILITIDDLDRLPDDQIQMIFRLLKTTVNFPNLHFLILGERHQLAKALDPIAHDEGDRYMEKIVQVPIHLPEADSVFLKNRLQEGLQLIANTYGYAPDGDRLIGRDDDFWKDFLKIKLNNLRVVYRLLTAVEFKCSAISYRGRLEVDLLDLLAIEFLRLYAPTTYDKILEQIAKLTRGFSGVATASSGEKKDNPEALSILQDSELGERGAYQACAHLFPNFADAVAQWSSDKIPHSERVKKPALMQSDRPIWDPHYQPLYFKLSLDEKILSRSVYEQILGETEASKLKDELTELEPHPRWLLFQHIDENDAFSQRISNVQDWLTVLCDISDRLDNSSMRFFQSECHYAYRIWLRLFDEIPDGSPQIAFIESLFERTEAVTIPALLLEDLRDAADIRFSTHQVDKNELLPVLGEDKLDALSDQLLRIAIDAFRSKTYPISYKEGGRLYRLIYAIGPERFEKILMDSETIDFAGTLTIVEAISLAIHYRYHDSLQSPESLRDQLSETFFEELQKFATAEFWSKLPEAKPDQATLTEGQSVLLEHIRRGAESNA